MQIVHLEGFGDEADLLREYPSFPFEHGELRFSIGEDVRADWLVVPNFFSDFATSVPVSRRILVMREPSAVFPGEFLNQFGLLLSPVTFPGYAGIWHPGHAAHPPYFGLDFSRRPPRRTIDFAGFMAMRPPEKPGLVSAIVSRKTVLPGHRRRLAFLRRLKAALGDQLAIFGKGLSPVGDKAEAILPFRYHLVLENASLPGYWTEKLVDAYVGFAFPIVSGAPDLERWLPADSFLSIDLANTSVAVDAVTRALSVDLYARSREAIAHARNRIMREERLCQVIARVIAAHPDSSPRLARPDVLRSAPRAKLWMRVGRELGRIYRQAEERILSR